MILKSWLLALFFLICYISISQQDGFTVPNKIHFPYGSPYMGMIIAVATPIDLQNIDAFTAVSFEASYLLPTNQTNFTYPPILSRAFDLINRKSLYEALEKRIQKFGFEGKACLLRAICEATAYSFEHNGILGDLFHILLRPSTTLNEDLSTDYAEAEKFGERNVNCVQYEKNCSTSLLNMISKLDHKINSKKSTSIT